MNLSWRNGSQLHIVSQPSGNSSYYYDASGVRYQKLVSGVTTTYHLVDGVAYGEKRSNGIELQYLYDENGSVYGIRKNGILYYFLFNGQGDVIGIYDEYKTLQARYEYDAWGKLLSVTNASGATITSSTHIGNVNPFRYRGYYYDVETGFYYLNSRYYDPEVKRFLTMDSILGANGDASSYNLFVYCGNNPVNRVDPTGHFWSEIWEFAKTTVTEIGKAIGVLSPAYAGCGGAAVADGPLPIGDIIGAAGAALLTIGAIGYGIYQATQAPSISIPRVEEKEKEKDIALPPPPPTVIYRYGGTNPGNLTPKAKDKYTGLSFSTIPKPGAAMTTIEALNATGLVYAVRDGATHVSVRPVGGTMDDWINAGSGSVWTIAVKMVVIKWDGVN